MFASVDIICRRPHPYYSGIVIGEMSFHFKGRIFVPIVLMHRQE